MDSAAVPTDRYTIYTSGLNSSVYLNMLYFANLVNQYATDFTLITLPSGGGPTNMISVNDGKASLGTSTAESVKAAYEGSGDFRGKPQKRIRHVASFGFSLMFIYAHPDSPIQSISSSKERKLFMAGEPAPLSWAGRFWKSMAWSMMSWQKGEQRKKRERL